MVIENPQYGFAIQSDPVTGNPTLIVSDSLLIDIRLGLPALLRSTPEHAEASRPEDFATETDRAAFALWYAIHDFQRVEEPFSKDASYGL